MSDREDQLATLAAMSTTQLKAEWERVFGQPVPNFSPDLMQRALAYRLQERFHGGLPAATKRELARVAKQLKAGKSIASVSSPSLRPGTRLVREWRGKLHQVLVLDGAYLFEERRYSSLTRIAHTITGANWSGPRFFGLKQAKAAPAEVRMAKPARCAIYTRKSTEEGLEHPVSFSSDGEIQRSTFSEEIARPATRWSRLARLDGEGRSLLRTCLCAPFARSNGKLTGKLTFDLYL